MSAKLGEAFANNRKTAGISSQTSSVRSTQSPESASEKPIQFRARVSGVANFRANRVPIERPSKSEPNIKPNA